jgi:hypothetical protein
MDESSSKNKNQFIKPTDYSGTLFPTWVLRNFNQYELPPIEIKQGQDPCDAIMSKKQGVEFRRHQQFLADYMRQDGPFRTILLYHGLGSGKTISAINIINNLFLKSDKWNVYMLIKASLRNDPWEKELEFALDPKIKQTALKSINFIHYNAPNASDQFEDRLRETRDPLKHSIFVVDEVHEFIGTVLSNIRNDRGRARRIYDKIIQELQRDKHTRIVTLSATPVVHEPFELGLLFNMMQPGLFPTTQDGFDDLFLKNQRLSANAKNLFMRRILGKVSYFKGHTADTYATQKTFEVKSELLGFALRVYKEVEKQEEDLERRQRSSGRGGPSNIFQIQGSADRGSGSAAGQTFRSYSRQACNFVVPDIDKKINGLARPRRSSYGASDAQLIGRDYSAKAAAQKKYEAALDMFLNATADYWKKLAAADVKSGNTLAKEVDTFKSIYKTGDPEKAFEMLNKPTKCTLLESLYNSSPKMTKIMFLAAASPGSVMVYSSFVRMEGIDALKLYLQAFGYSQYSLNAPKANEGKPRFADFQLGSQAKIEQVRKAFNSPANKRGEKIKVILLSQKSTVGITLANVRQVHILEPYWQEVTISQAIGRAVRYCSHVDLPLEERTVDIFRYVATQPSLKGTADQLIHDLAKRKARLVHGFQQCMKEAAVDCKLFKQQNCDDIPDEKCHCFQFDLESSFKNVSQAFTRDLRNDITMDKGSYADEMKRHRVYEIQGKIHLGKEKYMEEDTYWFDPVTKVVYDHQLTFPIGKVPVGRDKLPTRIEDDVFLVEDFIQIPMIKS